MSKSPAFTAKEMTILLDKNFLLTKRVALEKTRKLLAVLVQKLQQLSVHQGFWFGEGTDTTVGKISKGENYKGLPYMVLDFPKRFHKDAIFTYRSMFWWGNEFSFTLHLGGSDALQYQESILRNLEKLKENEVYFCCNDTAWEYDFGEENYLSIADLDKKFIQERISKTGFIKLSRRLPLQNWEELIDYGSATYELFLECLQKKDF